MRGFLLLLLASGAFACGPAPPCCGPPPDTTCCVVPELNTSIHHHGVVVHCPHAVCAWVNEELDPAPCGCTWTGEKMLPWTDGRIGRCMYVDKEDKDHIIRGTVRWWTQTCMGHFDVVVRIQLEEDTRDVFVSYPTFEYNRDVGIHSGYAALARSGSEDLIPQAGVSDMFFEVIMEEPKVGVHMEIQQCDIDILDSGADDAFLLTTYEDIEVNITYAEPNGERCSYEAFMDGRYYSPFQRLRCTYALFNGTTTVDTFTHERSYMLLDPFDNGVRYD